MEVVTTGCVSSSSLLADDSILTAAKVVALQMKSNLNADMHHPF